MAGRVAAEARAFPIAVAGRARFETGLTQERSEQAVRLVREQVSLVGLHRFRERTVQQAYKASGKSLAAVAADRARTGVSTAWAAVLTITASGAMVLAVRANTARAGRVSSWPDCERAGGETAPIQFQRSREPPAGVGIQIKPNWEASTISKPSIQAGPARDRSADRRIRALPVHHDGAQSRAPCQSMFGGQPLGKDFLRFAYLAWFVV